MSDEGPSCCFVGDAFVDVQCNGLARAPVTGEDTIAKSIQLVCGGSAANTCRHFRSISKVNSLFVSSIGDKGDRLADFFFETLSSESLGEGLVRVCRPQSCCVVLSDESSGDRGFVTSHSQGSSLGCLNAAMVFQALDKRKRELNGKGIALFHLSGLFSIPAFQGVSCAKFFTKLRAENPAALLSLDTQFDASGNWGRRGDGAGDGGDEKGSNWLLSALPMVDLFLPSDTEAMSISETTGVAAAVKSLAQSAPGVMIVVTCGKEGVVAGICQEEEREEEEEEEEEDTREREFYSWSIAPEADLSSCEGFDSTGAGDSFAAGFLSVIVLELKEAHPAVVDSRGVAEASSAAAAASAAQRQRQRYRHPCVPWWENVFPHAARCGIRCAAQNCMQAGACNPPVGVAFAKMDAEKKITADVHHVEK